MIMSKMRKVNKVIALSLASMFAGSALGACGGSDPDAEKKKNSSILNVKIFNGGLGYAWLEELANQFMDIFKEVSFEEGKKGVYIAITPNKQFDGLHDNIASGADAEDIYYTSTSALNDFLQTDVVYDITSLMTADVYDKDGNVQLNATGDGWTEQEKSIADRINVDYYKDAFNLGTEEQPSYYSIPYEDTLSGIIVDWDLFKSKGWNDYEGLDGMPATMDDFYDLLYRIQKANYSAFTYSTAVGYYTRTIQRAVQAKVDGLDWYSDVYSDYTGEYDFNGDGQITDDEKITPATMSKVAETAGVKAAIDMALEMFSKDVNGNTYYDPNVVQGVSFGGAQQDFIMSKSANNRKRIAMILEGDWWENEARATFNSMGGINEADGYGKREFRFMPIPQVTENDKCEKYTIGSMSNGAVTIVNKKTVEGNAVKQRLAELWLQYQYSAKGLKTFTLHTGSSLPLEYEMTEGDLAKLTPFARNTWELRHSDQVEIVYDNPMMKSNEVRYGLVAYAYNATIGGATYTDTLFNNVVKMINEGKTITAADYIKGLRTYYDSRLADAYPAK